MRRRPPESTRTDTLVPCTTLFRSPLALGALQESRLLVGCQAGEKAMQILGHVEDHVAALRAPLLEDLGQVAMIEVRTPERVDDQRLEAVALAAPRLALLGEPSAQVLPRRHLTRSEESRVGKEGVSTCRSR